MPNFVALRLAATRCGLGTTLFNPSPTPPHDSITNPFPLSRQPNHSQRPQTSITAHAP
ncbi:hypothetical protein OG21DRAFT_1513241 [Imleria badia]|nr:hypothetical protein OG21DRAFT_1513241 [Imleria badia]